MRITLVINDIIDYQCNNVYSKNTTVHAFCFRYNIMITLLVSDIIGRYCETKECSPHTLFYRNSDKLID